MTATAICGSDLHLYDGHVPTMEEGDVLGHDPVGEVVGVGNAVRNPEVGDRVVVPFTVSCGSWWFRDEDMYSPCDDSNPDAEMGHSPAGLFGYPHVLGAGRVIAIDRVPERLDMARKHGDARSPTSRTRTSTTARWG